MQKIIFSLLTILTTQSSWAFLTEVGLSYGYQKRTFNASNYYQSESKTANVSFYFLEKLSLDINYTDAFYENQESDGLSTRVTQQSTIAAGADLVYVLTDKSSAFQPYIKGGTAHITKKVQVKYLNADTIDIPTKNGFAPSYGVGLKYKLNDRFSFKISYDVWKTPLDDGGSADDASFKAGISLFL
jgi:outer membrane protein W